MPAVLTIVPVLTGYMLNRTVLIPGLGTLLYYLLPCVVFVFWFYLGSNYSKSGWNVLQSAMIGNWAGFLSLLLYLWQFLLCDDGSRNLLLSALSQCFASNTILVTAKLALLFESEKNAVTQASITAMQILGLLLMVFIFSAGYAFGKARNRRRAME